MFGNLWNFIHCICIVASVGDSSYQSKSIPMLFLYAVKILLSWMWRDTSDRMSCTWKLVKKFFLSPCCAVYGNSCNMLHFFSYVEYCNAWKNKSDDVPPNIFLHNGSYHFDSVDSKKCINIYKWSVSDWLIGRGKAY